MNFAQVEIKFKELKRKYDTGAITEAEFKAQLEELMIQDEEGRWWIIGYETGQWYYHDGEKWVQAEPPQAPAPPPTRHPSVKAPPTVLPPEEAAPTMPPTGYMAVLLYGLSFLFAPVAGIIVFLIYRGNPSEQARRFGRVCLIISLATMVLCCIVSYVYTIAQY
ncbi:MAG: SHOCT domain-containing protein [Anaerolineales bacterium]|nr:SHOCT domain-containing protein [Anaerolineales bacterium]